MRTRYLPAALACILTVGGAAACGSPEKRASSSTSRPHVFLIVMENHDWSAIEGSPDAPYINRTLLPLGAHAERYFNPPGNHPSLPNYLWLEAGTNFGIRDDGSPAKHPLASTRHLTTLLTQHGIHWRAYEQGITGRDCPLANRYPYAARHDPFVYFADVTDGWTASSSTCTAHIRPLSELNRDLVSGRTAAYNFITPSLCSDMHDICEPISNSILQGDAFLSAVVPLILRSPAYRAGGVIFVTWDEGKGIDGPIGLIALSPLAKRGYASYRRYTHSSTLRTVEEMLGVRPFLGGAAGAADLSDLFRRLP